MGSINVKISRDPNDDFLLEMCVGSKAEIQLRALQDILDRVHGKATMRVEQTVKGISLNIDLTSSLEE